MEHVAISKLLVLHSSCVSGRMGGSAAAGPLLGEVGEETSTSVDGLKRKLKLPILGHR